MPKSRHFDTRTVHAGHHPDAETGAVVPPISLSTTFAQSLPGRPGPFEYSRTGNPTRRALQEAVADLEGAAHGVAFSSGSAAAMTVLQTLNPGDHLVACDDVYGGTYRLIETVVRPMGIEVTWADMTDPAAISGALRHETRMLWVESPTNPLLKLVDLAALAKVAARAKVRMVVDNTFATPVLQQPLSLGADTVLHSSTKYLNGHADVVGGVVVTNDDAFAENLRYLQNAVGAVPSPFDCYLTLRGLRTLSLRVRRQCETALAVATRLSGHEAVARVRYPGLPSHPQHALACAQMTAGGGMISFELRGGRMAAERLLSHLQLFVCAESLGGVESLAEHPASMTHAAIPPDVRESLGISEGLVRLSIGLEHIDDLWADLEAGF